MSNLDIQNDLGFIKTKKIISFSKLSLNIIKHNFAFNTGVLMFNSHDGHIGGEQYLMLNAK